MESSEEKGIQRRVVLFIRHVHNRKISNMLTGENNIMNPHACHPDPKIINSWSIHGHVLSTCLPLCQLPFSHPLDYLGTNPRYLIISKVNLFLHSFSIYFIFIPVIMPSHGKQSIKKSTCLLSQETSIE